MTFQTQFGTPWLATFTWGPRVSSLRNFYHLCFNCFGFSLILESDIKLVQYQTCKSKKVTLKTLNLKTI